MSALIELGHGDVLVGTCIVNGMHAVTFDETDEEYEIGEIIEPDGDEEFPDVAITFANIESLDVLITQLMFIRILMSRGVCT